MIIKIRKYFSLIFVIFTFLVILSYSFFILPHSLKVTSTTFQSDKIPADWNDVKIIHMSDFTITTKNQITLLKKTIKKLDEIKPDIIFFSGVVLDHKNNAQTKDEAIIEQLLLLQAPLGKFAVLSPNIIDETQLQRSIDILTRSGFNILNNQTIPLYNKTFTPLYLLALNNKTADAEKNALLATQMPTITLTPNPALFDETLPNEQLFLTFSSGSYGGFIHIPFLAYPFLPQDNKKYVMGKYQENNHTLFMSNGIGTPSTFPFRLFNKPSFQVVVLKSQT